MLENDPIPPLVLVKIPQLVKPRSVSQFGRDLDIIESPPPAGSGGGVTLYPFDVEFSGGPDPKDATVRPGTINGVLPSNFDDVFSCAASGTYYLTLTVTASDGEIASAVLSMEASPPVGVPTLQGQPPTAFAYLLGVIVDLTWYRTIGPGSLAAAGSEVFRVSKTSPAPGTLPYDIYYTWVITAV